MGPASGGLMANISERVRKSYGNGYGQMAKRNTSAVRHRKMRKKGQVYCAKCGTRLREGQAFSECSHCRENIADYWAWIDQEIIREALEAEEPERREKSRGRQKKKR